MLHSDWFSLIGLVSTNVSITDMMQGDNGNMKVLLGIATFTNYLVIYMIYHCVVVFCLYSILALYNMMKFTAVNEGLCYQSSNVLFQRKINWINSKTTEWEIYTNNCWCICRCLYSCPSSNINIWCPNLSWVSMSSVECQDLGMTCAKIFSLNQSHLCRWDL